MWKTILEIAKEYADLTLAITALITAFLLVAKHSKRLVEFLKDLINIPARIKTMSLELKTNKGSSLKDAIYRIEDSQEAFRQKFMFAIENTTKEAIGSAQTNPDGTYTFASTGLCEIFGVGEEAFLGNNWMDLVDEEDRERVIKHWQESMKYLRKFVCEYRIHTAAGIKTVKSSARPILDRNQKLNSWFIITALCD